MIIQSDPAVSCVQMRCHTAVVNRGLERRLDTVPDDMAVQLEKVLPTRLKSALTCGCRFFRAVIVKIAI